MAGRGGKGASPIERVLDAFVYKYPQLGLPIRAGQSQSRAYRDIVRRGILPREAACPFHGTSDDRLIRVDTPIGEVSVLYLANRRDFIRFVQAIRGRCEPIDVPNSLGAETYMNVTNWRKIHARKAACEPCSAAEWSVEFRRFTAESSNYQDCVVVVGKGYYSAVSPADVGFDPALWLEASLTIRVYHECAHVVCRRRFIAHKNAVRDEVVADGIGLIAAFREYDPQLARRFLGIQDGGCLSGGRLRHYLSAENTLPDAVNEANHEIDAISEAWKAIGPMDPFDFLLHVEEARI